VAQAETATQLYAVVEAGEAALDRLTVALSAAEFASMLILPPAGGTLDAATARPLIEAAQEKNVAALIADDAQLARTLRADGVHLSATKKLADAYAEARSILGRVGIVGVDDRLAGRSVDRQLDLGTGRPRGRQQPGGTDDGGDPVCPGEDRRKARSVTRSDQSLRVGRIAFSPDRT